jgi:hypothetical protein
MVSFLFQVIQVQTLQSAVEFKPRHYDICRSRFDTIKIPAKVNVKMNEGMLHVPPG